MIRSALRVAIPKFVIFGLVLAAVAWSLYPSDPEPVDLGGVPPAPSTGTTYLDGFGEIALPNDGTVLTEPVVVERDGVVHLSIPAGFDLDSIPSNLSILPGERAALAQPISHHDWGHWSYYMWDGLYSNWPYTSWPYSGNPGGTRNFWVHDWTDTGERQHVNAWTQNWNYYWVGEVQNRPGHPTVVVPQVAYLLQPEAMGQCPIHGSTYFGYSEAFICTSRDMPSTCPNDPTAGACAHTANKGFHNGLNAQPTIWIKAGLPAPYGVKNLITHEFGHILGLGHRLPGFCGSTVMRNNNYCSVQYDGYDGHDLDTLADIYNHGGT